MVREININNLPALCLGSSFLGSGGGGCEMHLRPTLEKALAQTGPIPLLSVDNLNDDDYIIAVVLVGTPVPSASLQTSQQLMIKPVIDFVKKDIGRDVAAIMPVEIGGVNALTPFCVAGELDVPVLDADLLGRAFPEIYMNCINIQGEFPKKVYLGNPITGEAAAFSCSSYHDVEMHGRLYAQSCPTYTSVMIPNVFSGRMAKQLVLRGTVNQSICIGRQTNLDDIVNAVNGKVHFQGRVIEYFYEIKKGFLTGTLLIQTNEDNICKITVKNEYLQLQDPQTNFLAQAPDIISLLRTSDLKPILSDRISVGDEVICVTCKGPEIWYTDAGLSLIRASNSQEA